MKKNNFSLLAFALISASLTGCPSGTETWFDPYPPWGQGHTDTKSDAGSTTCTPLVIMDPAISLAGVDVFLPDEKRNNPEAGMPSYVYLSAGQEGVVVNGPSVPSAAGLLSLESPTISKVGVRDYSADGYQVVVNSAFTYLVSIRDFEDEVALAQVELCETNGMIESRFLFRGQPGASGVAHEITIVATANGVDSSPSQPVTVEVR